MGSEAFYPEERPVRPVTVDGFWMDAHPVTVAEFRRFTKATGHVTVAERELDPRDFPGAERGALVPGALVFTIAGAGGSGRLAPLVVVRARGLLAPAPGRGQHDARPGAPSGDAGGVRGRRRVRGVGGSGLSGGRAR